MLLLTVGAVEISSLSIGSCRVSTEPEEARTETAAYDTAGAEAMVAADLKDKRETPRTVVEGENVC